MGRPKGGKNRKWTNEERLKYVLLCEEELQSPEYVERNYGVSINANIKMGKNYQIKMLS